MYINRIIDRYLEDWARKEVRKPVLLRGARQVGKSTEDMPTLHVVAAGSLLEFALEELPTFGVGRIHSMFMYPMTFDEFLNANGEILLMEARDKVDSRNPLATPLHERLVSLFRTYLLVGGMPEVVARWVNTHDYMQCQELQDDILLGYEDGEIMEKSAIPEIKKTIMILNH